MTRAFGREVAALVLVLGVPCLPLSRWEREFASVGHLVGYEVIWWAIVAVLLLYVLRVERRPLSSIGFRKLGARGALLGIGAGIVSLVILSVIYYAVFPLLHVSEAATMNQLIATPLWWRVVSVIRGAVSEEILFRGYAIERLQELTGSVGVAGVLSCATFAVAHVSVWGWGHVLIAGVGGAIFTSLYIWRRNLWTNSVAHFVVDGVGLLLIR